MTGAVLTQDPARPPAVLLTGAAGFVGRHVGYALRASGWSVLAIDLRSRGLGPDGRGIELVDSADPRILRDVARGHFDAVVHQAAISDTLETDRRLLTTQNVRKALDLAGACAESRTRFIYASSSSVYGHIVTAEAVAEDAVHDRARCTGPLNEYARSKLTLDEEMASRHPDGLEWAGLRYTNVFGTGEEHKGRMASIISQLITRAADRRPLELFADTLLASRDYIPVEFVAATIVAVLHRGVPAGIYNVGSGTALSFARLLEWCAAFAAPDPLEVRLTPNPYADRYQYWTCADLTRLRTALPHLPTVRLQEVEAAASSLFTARRGGTVKVAARSRQETRR